MKNHPEASHDETFLGNVLGPLPAHLSGIAGMRLGAVAFDIAGGRLDSAYRPVIGDAPAVSAHNRIMEARLSAIRAI